jgi:hypothetical protein
MVWLVWLNHGNLGGASYGGIEGFTKNFPIEHGNFLLLVIAISSGFVSASSDIQSGCYIPFTFCRIRAYPVYLW